MGQGLSTLDNANPPAERERLLQPPPVPESGDLGWKEWGTYLGERQWGTVREDYSAKGDAWSFFSHNHARSRAYRWGEDGLMGFSDSRQRLCFAMSLWNEKDPLLKERLYGLTNDEGCHGEDVKEVYFYIDSTPTHSYTKGLYKYPMAEYPYKKIVDTNARRRQAMWDGNPIQMEYELLDTGVLNDNKYFDVFVEYAKETPDSMLIAITVENPSDQDATIHILPTLWFRNTWSWNDTTDLPSIQISKAEFEGVACATTTAHDGLSSMTMLCKDADNGKMLFCDNETNFERLKNRDLAYGLYKRKNTSNYPKDGINDYIVHGQKDKVNPDQRGTKVTPHYKITVPAKRKKTLKLKLLATSLLDGLDKDPFATFDEVLETRKKEADEFFNWVSPYKMNNDRRSVQRQAFANLMWSKQFYFYIVNEWLVGGPDDRLRDSARNRNWINFRCADILSLPDKWEYPWFAAWDTAAHCISIALIDPELAKEQCKVFLKPTMMSPEGQIPAYEWDFSDVNPPTTVWAVWRIYQLEYELYGKKDIDFLVDCFPQLQRYFTWFINRKDADGHLLIEGGFLGLDNIGIIDRTKRPDSIKNLYQADGTSWVCFSAAVLMKIALELSGSINDKYAMQFLINFFGQASALTNYRDALPRIGYESPKLWSEEDGFYYDVIRMQNPDGSSNLHQMKVRTLVGVIPLIAVTTFPPDLEKEHPQFADSLKKLIINEQHFKHVHSAMSTLPHERRMRKRNLDKPYLIKAVDEENLRRILSRLLDPNEFLSEYGFRSSSKLYGSNPFKFNVWGQGETEYKYNPAESYGSGWMYGGNSNWRGPIWIFANYLILESLVSYYNYYQDEFKIEFPTGSGIQCNLKEVALDVAKRILSIFEKGKSNSRPTHGSPDAVFNKDNRYSEYVMFYEYFHGENGAGLGACHQGWTCIIAEMISQVCNEEERAKKLLPTNGVAKNA